MADAIPYSVRIRNSWTRLTNWEYWPMHVVYFPIYCYWLWLSLRSRSFFYFSAANPGIPTGGMLGESKFDILEKIPAPFKPATILVKQPASLPEILEKLEHYQISFPLVAKPDVGERGWLVEKIHNLRELKQYLMRIRADFLIQAYVDSPLELGLFYYRLPDRPKGVVSSVVVKEFLALKGDGTSTVEALILRSPRACLQYAKLREKYHSVWQHVLPQGQELELEPIGNHCRGTTFLNGSAFITADLVNVFDQISQSIEGFYYGRYDLRCTSLEDLYQGKGIQIMELNGVGAEPGHIYHPGFSLWEGYKVLFKHWSVMCEIAWSNHRKGIPYMKLEEVRQIWQSIQKSRNLQEGEGGEPEIRCVEEDKVEAVTIES